MARVIDTGARALRANFLRHRAEPRGLAVAARVPPAALALVLAWSALDARPACAESLPPYPGIAHPHGAYGSHCLPFSLVHAPSVLQIGQQITATAGPPTAQCGGPASTVTWNWEPFDVGTTVSGCGAMAPLCVQRADSLADRWRQACVAGGSAFGGWEACGLYFVLDHQFEVSGKITRARFGGQGAVGVHIRASCPGGGSTTTDAAGGYNFLLRRGPCTIAAVLPAGERATPAQRKVKVTHDIGGVDFRVGRVVTAL